MALVAFQCAVNYLYALIMGHTVLKQGEDTTKSSFYACASLTYLLAMVTSNKALSWVNYPTQVIGKSCKPIPVMVLGVLVGGKKYPTLKYLFILMIIAMNKWSIGYLLVGLLITGEGVEFISFLQRHPSVLWELASFSVASALGQFFIFMTVSDFGPLPCSIITTTRKFFTVLASVIFFGNSLVTRQWIGTVFVFAGIFLDGLYGKQKAPDAKTSKD